MDTCKICEASLTGPYYRIGTDTVCASCADRLVEKMDESGGHSIPRGILFAFLAACVGGLLRWELEATAADSQSFKTDVAPFLRYFILLAIMGLIIKAAKVGSRGGGGMALQWCAAVFTYLAITLAMAPVILAILPGLGHGLSAALAAVLISLELPFIVLTRDFFNGSTQVLTLLGVAGVFVATAKPKLVEGPFSAAPEEGTVGQEKQMFKGLGL